ncbi:MAG: hypothetical protein KDN22_09185 [Verrucomicrobiae bacterium]|nr:hypothetical protein [Verrucomicrobiae bacterium]
MSDIDQSKMSLREQLREILPEILPANPAEPIKGTDLIQLVKYRLKQSYSDATLRYHFSIMCCDPSSPIAKVDQGQGYYRRQSGRANINSARHSVSPLQARFSGSLFDSAGSYADSAISRADQFCAIFQHYEETSGRFPFVFDTSFGADAPYENFWKCPDAVVVDWHVQAVDDDGPQITPELVAFKRNMGIEPFSMISTKLKLSVSQDSFREDFFQALSISRWAHRGQLVIAASIPDEQLVEHLRLLGTEYGIGIVTLGLDTQTLDDLPSAIEIQNMHPREKEALLAKITPRVITIPSASRHLSWAQLESVRRDNSDFDRLFSWVQRCLSDHRAYSQVEWVDLTDGTAACGTPDDCDAEAGEPCPNSSNVAAPPTIAVVKV